MAVIHVAVLTIPMNHLLQSQHALAIIPVSYQCVLFFDTERLLAKYEI